MSLNVKHGGAWKPAAPWVKHNGVWKQPKEVFTKHAGVWESVWTAGFTYSKNMSAPFKSVSNTAIFTATTAAEVPPWLTYSNTGLWSGAAPTFSLQVQVSQLTTPATSRLYFIASQGSGSYGNTLTDVTLNFSKIQIFNGTGLLLEEFLPSEHVAWTQGSSNFPSKTGEYFGGHLVPPPSAIDPPVPFTVKVLPV